ncbi:MAG: hypothetical protein N2321_11645 [Melioribacteraceae bacterium]|nr:hypothetical protein [Melioribacteraceae bacterium]
MKKILLWLIAFLITAGSAVYQRMTGPTYPKTGKVELAGKTIKYKLERSHVSSSNYLVEIETNDPEIKGELYWRPYQNKGEFNFVEMKGTNKLSAELPARKPLEKWEYFVKLHKGNEEVTLPGPNVLIIRFKGDVPLIILIPHIIFMFGAMMLSTRTALEFFNKPPKYLKLTIWTLVFLFIGGFPLGFAMNWFAFGEMWGGFPFGNDITDNKTLVAFIGWIVAYYFVKKDIAPKLFTFLAALLMLIVYMIPHSV